MRGSNYKLQGQLEYNMLKKSNVIEIRWIDLFVG